jgi:hypothetical protein
LMSRWIMLCWPRCRSADAARQDLNMRRCHRSPHPNRFQPFFAHIVGCKKAHFVLRHDLLVVSAQRVTKWAGIPNTPHTKLSQLQRHSPILT